jgi:hypothetical protein
MADRTWIGGGNNDASDPNDWSPTGVPLLGDGLLMPDGGTMNIIGNDLVGDRLQVGNPNNSVDVTLNLSHNATATVTQVGFSNVQTTVAVAGEDTLNYNSVFPSSPFVTVNLKPHAKLAAAFDLTFGRLDISGAPGSQLINDQGDVFHGTHVVITPDVLGTGSFAAGGAQAQLGFIEFERSVSSGQNITVSGIMERGPGTLQIDEPRKFHASVTLQGLSQIDLVGLAKADSYTYANDMLSIYSHNRVIDTLRLTNQSGAFPGDPPHDLLISKSGSNVWVTEQGLSSPPPGSIQLPLHMFV